MVEIAEGFALVNYGRLDPPEPLPETSFSPSGLKATLAFNPEIVYLQIRFLEGA
jgi:hypothetical protein